MLAEARLRLAEVASTSYAAQTVQRRLAGWGRRCVGARPPSPRQRQRRAAVLVRSSAADDFGERIRKWARGQMQQGRQGQRQGQQPEDGGGGAPTISSGDGMGASMSAGSGGAAGSDSGRQRSVWTDWSGQDEDWDEWKSQVVVDLEDVEELAELREAVIERRRQRRGKRSNVRDEYLRPIVDPQGIYNRLAYDEKEVEERVFIEAITNQYESREALKYGLTLVAVPLAIGFAVSRLVAQPLWDYAQERNPQVFALRDEQKVEGAHELHMEEIRLRMEAALGQAPPLNEEALLERLSEEAGAIDLRGRQANKQALLNVVSDSISAGTIFVMLLQDNERRTILLRTIGRIFVGLSDTAKAFMIILITDILLGYHSEEGWTAAMKLIGGHYGIEAEKEFIFLFVAIVPVVLDSLFKVWIFLGLNKQDPAAAVTLRQLDRH